MDYVENRRVANRTPLVASKKQIAFAVVHLLPLLAIFTEVTTFDWIVCLFLYFSRMFFVTAGYHRYFSHRTFKTSRVFQFILAFLAETSAQKGVLWWSAHHRVHHKHSDTLEDPHSMKLFGFWYSHLGWILGPDYESTENNMVKDLSKFPELVWISKYYLIPPTVLGVLVYFLGVMVNGSGWSTLLIGFFLSTVLLYHGTFSINSIMHKFGKARYRTGDESKNSFWLALISMGEGWHNNHHYYQRSTSQGFFWWEIDFTYYILKILSLFGLVWDLSNVPDHVKYNPEKLINAKV